MHIPKALHASTALVVAASLLVTVAGCSSSSAAGLGSGSAASTSVDTTAAAYSAASSQDSDQINEQGTDSGAATSAAVSDTFPDNPSENLPDTVSSSLPDSSTYVSPDYVQKKDGTLVSATSGKKVTDPEIVGTEDTPPDPLAKTNGKSFIPVSVEDVRDAVDNADSTHSADGTTSIAAATTSGAVTNAAMVSSAVAEDATESDAAAATDTATVTEAKLQNNQYGAYWGTYNNSAAFFQKGGSLFVQQAKGVVDVSQWQGTINWSKAKAAGVQGAIIRIGYGGGYWDTQAKRNISECKRLGIPFGIYLYSYASTTTGASTEATKLVSMLKSAGASASTLKYPVFYDLENWTSGGSSAPTSASKNTSLVNTWYAKMQASGYKNLSVYSYTSWLNTALNSSSIRSRTRWVADYGPRMGFTSFSTNDRGWQYSSSGKIAGISGSVDLNAFGVAKAAATGVNLSQFPLTTLPNGRYYINAYVKDSSSISTRSGSTGNSAAMELRGGNGATYQQFDFTRQSNGSYAIRNVRSGKMLDVKGGKAKNNVVVQQYQSNGSKCQRWFIRDTGAGYVLQSALGNWALDISGGKKADGTKVQLFTPNAHSPQKFGFASVTSIATGTPMIMRSALNTKMNLEIWHGSKSNGTHAQLYKWNAYAGQRFKFTKTGNGVYTIANMRSGKNLEVTGGKTANHSVVGQYRSNGAPSQRWMIRNYGGGVYGFVGSKSGKFLDLPGDKATASNRIQIYSYTGSKAQKWAVASYNAVLAGSDPMAAKYRSPLANGTYYIEPSKTSKYALAISGYSTANSVRAQLSKKSSNSAQKWRVTHDSKGYVILTNVHSGKRLDVKSSLAQNHGVVQQYKANGIYSQRWIAVKVGSSYKLVSSLNTSVVVDLASGRVANKAKVQLYTSNGLSPQHWKFVRTK